MEQWASAVAAEGIGLARGAGGAGRIDGGGRPRERLRDPGILADRGRGGRPRSEPASAYWKVEVARPRPSPRPRTTGPHGLASRTSWPRAGLRQGPRGPGQVLKAMGQTGQAIDQFREAVRTGNATPSAWNNLAWYLVTRGTPGAAELDEALWAARRAVYLTPRSTCWDTLAEVLFRKGDLPGAIAATREAIRLTRRCRNTASGCGPSARPCHADPEPCKVRPSRTSMTRTSPSRPSSSGTSTEPTDRGGTLPLPPDHPASEVTTADSDTDAGRQRRRATFEGEFDDIFEDPTSSSRPPPAPTTTIGPPRSTASDFDLEEPDWPREVFALDEDDVHRCRRSRGDVSRDEDFSAERASSGEMSSGGVESESTASFPVFSAFGRLRPSPARPLTVTDRVHFSLTAPATLEPGSSYALDVWAYLEAQRAEVMALARESQGTDDIRVKTKTGSSSAGRRPDRATGHPDPGGRRSGGRDRWDGEIGNATFPVSVPAEARPGPHAGSATFHVDQLKIAKLHFVLEVGRGRRPWHPWPPARCGASAPSPRTRARTATRCWGGSRASCKVLPDLDLFLDVASLRSGERWEERLHQEIARRDTLYLFWSHAASRSPWVESRVADRAGAEGYRGDRPGPPRLARGSPPAGRTCPAPPLQ